MSYAIGTVIDTIFQFADRNRNGRIDVGGAQAQGRGRAAADETRLGMRDRLVISAAAKVKRFPIPSDLGQFAPLIDTNRDGALTRAEARAFVTRFDTNKDNALDDREIRDGLTRAVQGRLS